MGKHKSKFKKHKKDKKKKSRNERIQYSSSSEEEWVEKNINSSSSEKDYMNKEHLYKRGHNFKGDKQASSSEDDEKSKKSKMEHRSSLEERSNNKHTSSSDDERKKKTRKHKREHSSSSEEWVEKRININKYSDDKRIEKKSYSHKRKSKYKEYAHGSSSEDEMVTFKKQKRHTSSSSEEEWVEKKLNSSASSDERLTEYKLVTVNEGSQDKREDWMSLSSSFLTSSNSDRKRKRNEAKKLEREKQQYDPRRCARELNPYWKDGGDGLPKFKKPNLEGDLDSYYGKTEQSSIKTSNWRRKNVEESNPEKSTASLDSKNSDTILSEKELNQLAAKLVKAEIMGNTKLITELKEQLDKARSRQQDTKASKIQEEEILLTHTDSQGRAQPLKLQSEYGESSGHHKRKKNIETHKDGQRVRYFADDDKYSLKQMFEKEKYNSVEDQNKEFVKMASKIRKNDDLDDIFSDNIRKEVSDTKIDSKNRDRAINEHQKVTQSLNNCSRCIQSELMLKHLMISMKETSYLSLPSFEPLTEGHCFIIPIRHVPCSTQLDENEWTDILDTRRALVRLFKSRNEEVIFFETAIYLHRFPHMYIECIPMPKEEGEMAPIYFKKAIDESETEWAYNKKLVSLKGRDVRKAIPKGLPYFSVSFGLEEGFAHVIEDEQLFPNNFAQEIIGGMLDVHHSKWRKPKKQSFDEQSKRVLAFSKDWSEFDPT